MRAIFAAVDAELAKQPEIGAYNQKIEGVNLYARRGLARQSPLCKRKPPSNAPDDASGAYHERITTSWVRHEHGVTQMPYARVSG